MSSKRRELDLFIGGGSATYCSLSTGACSMAATAGFTMPNGLVRGADGLFYIPSSFIDNIRVMALQDDNTLKQVDVIHLGMPVDNLSVDENGDIWAAAFPKVMRFLDTFGDPHGIDSPSTIWKITRKAEGGYSTTKVLEDRDAGFVAGATVAVHDVRSGKIFVGGM